MSTYNYKPGLGQVAAYQVSGAPYVNGPKDKEQAFKSVTVTEYDPACTIK